MDELKERKVIRTFNNPVADYAEWLVALKQDLAKKDIEPVTLKEGFSRNYELASRD